MDLKKGKGKISGKKRGRGKGQIADEWLEKTSHLQNKIERI